MIPHTDRTPLRTRNARLRVPSRRWAGSAELSCHESVDGTTGGFSFSKRFRLGEDANHRLGSRGTHEHAAPAVELRVEPFDILRDGLGDLPLRNAHVGRHLGKALQLR